MAITSDFYVFLTLYMLENLENSEDPDEMPHNRHFIKTLSQGYETFFILSSTQMSKKFQLLVNTKIPTNKEISCFKSLRRCIYHADKC